MHKILYTISRITWERQIEHSPNVIADLVEKCKIPKFSTHIHINLSTISGWLKLKSIRHNYVAILDAITGLPYICSLLKPELLLSTYGDRHFHVLLEPYHVFDRILDVVEKIEILDAQKSNIVKSSGLEALAYINSKTDNPEFIYVPDVFQPYSGNRKIFLYQGNLRWHKGFNDIIDYAEMNNAELLIIGEGPYRKKLQKIAKRKTFIKLLGRVDDPEPYWRIADEIVMSRSKARCNEFSGPGLIERAKINNKTCVYFRNGEITRYGSST